MASVRDCGVAGVPDDKWGERVVAVVQLHPDSTADEAELITAVKTRIGSVKAPKQVLIWPDLPGSTVGKVRETAIKDQLRSA